ncbi:nicotinate-nucleotide--dimethylbenzimidazole phosphoribosyltransferase [Cochlodiniinecator piscidefendens]|uniref:nicotinate-nucleotide--dimethylbenzimidazole phosphoribosyltransferase n=1 Tax=Cochlodiniinecator piscidefendens TaxID=2715756 RepID=UPI00140CBBCB|nr:nicotinate-nucleotide--dimethylbenzimidazole phosphoribosyltransferase [Cochlodiniinecator piscidefendens]
MTAPAFSSLSEFETLVKGAPALDAEAVEAAKARNGQLTKPPGALGRLEDVAIWYAGWRGTDRPELKAPQIVIFAGNHGVTKQGVSAFPAEVTEQMVLNFQHGGAAINQLANCFGSKLDVHALSLDTPTEDFTQAAAMSEADLVEALLVGWNAVESATDLLVTGEMGIGNTTSAAAIFTKLVGGNAEDWTGRGTGVEGDALSNKIRVVQAGVDLHSDAVEPLEVLRCLGGREIAAMAGAMARARILRIPVLLDGFICTSAAAVLDRISSDAVSHMIAAHVSDEAAHAKALAHLGKEPLLNMGMRLGEGSGAGLAVGILKAAIACHSGMATFAEAGVSDA